MSYSIHGHYSKSPPVLERAEIPLSRVYSSKELNRLDTQMSRNMTKTCEHFDHMVENNNENKAKKKEINNIESYESNSNFKRRYQELK